MQRKHPITGETRKQPGAHHRASPTLAFFGGLEDEIHRAIKMPGAGKITCRADQHRDMAIMATAMEHARRAAGIRQVGLLVHRQRVHISAQANGTV